MKLMAIAKRAVPFFLGLAVGILPSFIFSSSTDVSPVVVEHSVGYGKSKSYCDTGRKKFKSKAYKSAIETPLAIESNPRPGYTDVARRANTEGTVKLRVEFRSDGTIGDVGVIEGLPNALTEKAIDAAKKIRFRPAVVDGVTVDSSKMIEYTFALY